MVGVLKAHLCLLYISENYGLSEWRIKCLGGTTSADASFLLKPYLFSLCQGQYLTVEQLTLDFEYVINEVIRNDASWSRQFCSFSDYDIVILEVGTWWVHAQSVLQRLF